MFAAARRLCNDLFKPILPLRLPSSHPGNEEERREKAAAGDRRGDHLHNSSASTGLPSVLNPLEKFRTDYPRMISDGRRFEFSVGNRPPDRHIAAFAERRRFSVGVDSGQMYRNADYML
jgi:hypothetical protein